MLPFPATKATIASTAHNHSTNTNTAGSGHMDVCTLLVVQYLPVTQVLQQQLAELTAGGTTNAETGLDDSQCSDEPGIFGGPFLGSDGVMQPSEWL